MRVLATIDFNNKLKNLNDNSLQDKLLRFVNTLSEITNLQDINNQFELTYNNVYVHKIDNFRIFFSIEDSNGIFTIILADLVKKDDQAVKVNAKNPIYNRTINPTYNRTINPIYNHTINPIYNHTINPIYNHTINPIYNHTINPIYNHTINPIYNHTINPIYNHTINPIYNRTLNPSLNPLFEGYYLYDLGGSPQEYITKASDKILIIFDFNNKANSYGVNFNDGYAIFESKENTQTSYFISDGLTGFNQFDLGGRWIGYVK